jgi:hypothetical protein
VVIPPLYRPLCGRRFCAYCKKMKIVA